MLIRAVIVSLWLGSSLGALASPQMLPKRLVLCVDGIAWRDLKALQDGVVTDRHGHRRAARAFNQGYFPVSRMVSTFPSCSDVAWSEMFGNAPLPGYQRSYFDIAANQSVAQNGITTTMEYENQMHWQQEGGWHRALGYLAPVHEFKREVRLLVDNFLHNSADLDTYYALLRTTDDAQHMSADIFSMLQFLDQRLQQLQAEYRAATGHALEILILSDHGNNHAGPGKRVPVLRFLKQAGYRVTKSIRDPRDVVLPIEGIESWVEIHNAPAETPALVSRLLTLEGVDLIAAISPGNTNEFVVCNRAGARALITCDPARERFRYARLSGDPLDYGPVVESLRQSQALDAEGFASVAAWRAASMCHRYPVALERITRGLTSVTRNPATILLSLDNRYVHAGFFVLLGSRLVTCAGTHGGLDDLNSTGIVLSNFAPTRDATAAQLAAQWDYFPRRHETRCPESR